MARFNRPQAARSVVGLDVEPGFIAAAEVSVNGSISVERCATARIDAPLFAEGEVVDVDGLAAALRELFDAHELPKRVRVGLANARVAVRTLELPPITDRKDLDAAVRFQAADELPIPIDQAAIDYRSLGLVATEEGPRTRVVVVAAQREMVARLLGALRGAGLRPEGVDLSAFALIRALARPAQAAAADAEQTGGEAVLYVSAGGLTNLAVAQGLTCRFTRVASGGTEAIASDLAPRHGLTLEHARQWISHVGLRMPVAELDGDQAIVASARTALEEGVRRVAADVQTSLEYYGAQGGVEPVARIVLSGPALAIDGFFEQFAAQVQLPVEPGLVGGALGDAHGAAVAVAAGLAVEEAPGA